jgi:hypothetical protein
MEMHSRVPYFESLTKKHPFMLTRHIALVCETKRIGMSELLPVSAALQKQATNDLGPAWSIRATVDAFTHVQDVPPGYWPIFVRDDIKEPGAEGYHTDENRQPFALVRWSPTWALTVSHEMLEMLVDPFGDRLVASASIKPGQGTVNYLVEVCDPCESTHCAYPVNGIPLSDFYTPDYFDAGTARGVRYSIAGNIKRPLQLLKEGYLSWMEPSTGKWFQSTWFGTKPEIREVTARIEGLDGSIRERLDRIKVHG